MKTLVLGGTQFIGRALARDLIARGHEVSILTRGRLPVDYAGVCAHYRADRTDAESLRELRGVQFDAVFDVSGYRAADVRPVLEVLHPGEGTHYVFLSSGAVYAPSDEVLAEDAPCGANANWGAYGLDKLGAEELLCERQSEQGYRLSIVRPTYVYGSGNNLYREAYLFDRLERGLAIPLPNSAARTQFVQVSDLVEVLAALPLRTGGGVEVFNCTHPESLGWAALVQAAADAVGVEPIVQPVEYRGSMKAREFFPFRDCTYLLDVGKLERFGLPQPGLGIREGLRETYEWYCQVRPSLCDPKMNRVEEALRLQAEWRGGRDGWCSSEKAEAAVSHEDA